MTKYPIKYKLTAIILLVFLPLSLFALHHYYVMHEHEKEDTRTHNLFIAGNVANDLENIIASSFSALRSLAMHPAVIGKDTGACDGLFAKLLPSFPGHINILAAGMDGNNFGSGVQSPGVHKLNYDDKEWFIKARQGRDVVGDLHISKLFKTPSVMIAIPVFDKGSRQVGVIGMPLDLSLLRQSVTKLLPGLAGNAITIVDAKDNILVCTGEVQNPTPETCATISPRVLTKMREGSRGNLEEKGLDGVERLYSYVTLPETGWRVIVGAPKELVYQASFAFSTRYLTILAMVGSISLILSFLLSKRLTRNLSSLISGLREIEQGNLSATLSLEGNDELQDVALTFNSMAAKRRETEKQLRESESFSAAVLNGIGEGVVVVGKDYRVLSANHGYCDQVHVTCDEVIGKHCYEVSHHIDQPCFEKEGGCDCTVKKCFETGERHRSMHMHYDEDGSVRYVETNAYPLKNQAGEITSAIETLMDVTGLVNLENQLTSAKDRYRKLYDGAPDMMHSVDRDGHIIICNKTEAKALGYEVEELVGRPQKDIIAPEDREECMGKMGVLVTSGFFEAECTLLAKDGRRIPAFVKAVAIYDKDGAFLMSDSVLRDITEKKNLEAQLSHAQKMEAVGLLAGGVAHDFNNILTAIVGYGSLLRAKMGTGTTERAYVEQVLLAAERATTLTKGLLAFSRKQIINPKPIHLGDVVRQLENILIRMIGEDIELRVFLAPQEASVMADASQIEQVLMNLATNARDAMPDGGVMVIESEVVEFDAEYVRRHAFARPGKYLLLSVTDTGQGIDEKTKEQIFEPFFTTKEKGKGTGLGLSMVYGIIKQHNGYINLYSEPGEGTTFKIYLPVIDREAENLEIPVFPPVQGGTESILLAEDAALVSDLAKKILEEFGYRVNVAANGVDAVERYKADPEVDLLILDVIMPGKNGKEVYTEIRGMNPDIKALFMSGYTANIIHKKGILDSGIEFISKPFSPNALLRKVREVLDSGPAA